MNNFDLNNYPLWTALITPFNEEGKVDYEDLLNLLKEQEGAKNGVLILGSTGEALNLDLETRKEIIKFSCEQNLNVPIMVGVGGAVIEATKSWVDWLNNQAIHSLLLVTPLYSKPGRHGQTQWFQTLLDTAKKPCVLYNVPGRTGIEMNFDSVKDVVSHENFYGIKEASGSVEKFKAYAQAAPGKKMFCGDDGLMPEFTQAGGNGLISVASNVWPEATHTYVQQNLNGTFKDDALWKDAANSLFLASNPIPAKRLLENLKRIKSAYLQLPLHAKDLENIEPVLAENTKIETWLSNSK